MYNPVPFFTVNSCYLDDYNYLGTLVGQKREIKTPEDCQKQCLNNLKCNSFSFNKLSGSCLMWATAKGTKKAGFISGPKTCKGEF